MTDLITRDPNDTGEIPTLVGETTHRITAEQRARLVGEATENLNQYLIPSGPFPVPLRHNTDAPVSLVTGHGYDPEADSGPVVDLVETVVIHDLAAAQPIYPLERVITVEQLAGAEADITGELTTPPPIPPKPPANPSKYRARHRLTLHGRWRRLPSEVRGLVKLAGILLATGAILWVIS